GTTQNNADAWFAGFTPKLTAAVWMGYPDGQISMDNVHGVKVQGGNFPAEIWRTFMETATADFDTGTFPEIDPAELADGETLDPNYGKTQVVSGTTSSTGAGATPTTQAQTATTVPPTTSAPTTAPPTTSAPTTAPPTTAPPTTAAPTSAPATNGAGPDD
ncbi:MAG: hypothetical protein KDA98_03060, partial [Acidimicrobiales bacterium]|nr:hypothetical protein [Acidimicrobiales bacterium]